jgi:hypothetical protein
MLVSLTLKSFDDKNWNVQGRPDKALTFLSTDEYSGHSFEITKDMLFYFRITCANLCI